MIIMGNSVKVTSDSLLSWKSEMSKLNDEAVDIVQSIENDLTKLNDSWKGESADGFETTMENTLKTIISYHNQMGNVENSLSTIVSTMENQ